MGGLRRVCVFCGSSLGTHPPHEAAAITLGATLADRGIGVVYGGAAVGLMGALADAALAAGGEVIGVIPEGLFADEVGHEGLTELLVVATLSARKELMASRADAFIALPGGYGTLDELFEMLSWTQLGVHDKPCGVLDVDDYFEPLRMMLDRAVRDGLLSANGRELLRFDDDATRLLDALAGASAPPSALP